MEIKINNSKLKIVKVPFERGDSSITLINKAKLKYQFVILTNPVDNKLCPQKKIDMTGIKKTPLDSNISDSYTECWSLELEKNVPVFKDNSYTVDELKLIMSFLYVLVSDNQDTSEILSLCTEDYNIISKFYSSYGKSGIDSFKNYIKECIRDPKYSPKITKEHYPINYARNKYSIQNLITDLIIDGAEILTNKYLIGEIDNISIKRKDTSGIQAPSENEWYKVLGVLGNKTRANLSIRFSKKVMIFIPNNDLGIDSGMKKFESTGSICLVRDGVLWQKTLGVRVSSKLAGKLKRLGMVKGDLLYPGEYLIDLSLIPIVSKSKIKEVTSSVLAELEVRSLLADIAIEYLNYMYPDVVETLSKEEEFYKSLGIVNGVYYPKDTETVKTGKSYSTTELISTISGLPINHSERLKEFSRIKSKKSYSGAIYSFINNLGITPSNVIELKKKWKLEKANISLKLRDAKFQIITSRSSKFSEKGNPFIDNIVKSVNIGLIDGSYSGYTVNVSWKFKQKVINL